jgi:acyl dehydratase
MNDASLIHTKPGEYFEDYPVGAVFVGGPVEVSEQEILDFARRYDAQLMHIDKAAAEAGQFGGLIASGWHTGSLTMRLMVEHFVPTGNLASPGLDELRWLLPVRPGDKLEFRWEVVEVKRSASKPDRGMVRTQTTVTNQAGVKVMTYTSLAQMPARTTG